MYVYVIGCAGCDKVDFSDKVDFNDMVSCTSLGGINIRMLFLGLILKVIYQ
jgi:hypothetical protein